MLFIMKTVWTRKYNVGGMQILLMLKDAVIDLILPAALWSTQPLKEMGTRNLPGAKGRPARKAHSLTTICQSIV
jgi:hypothetical protein